MSETTNKQAQATGAERPAILFKRPHALTDTITNY